MHGWCDLTRSDKQSCSVPIIMRFDNGFIGVSATFHDRAASTLFRVKAWC